MSFLSFNNVSGFILNIEDHINKAKAEVAKVRQAAAMMYVDELIKGIPVWSGRTMRSIRVNNTGQTAPREGRLPWPDDRFGHTSRMAMGTEPMFASASAQAYAQAASADYDFYKPIHITVNSVAWALIEDAKAPWGRPSARNKAVVSEIAKSKVRARFPQLK